MIRDLEKHLRRSIKKHGVPGASVAVLRGKRITGSAAAGVLNLNTGVPATADSVFQIGSITKPFTASMIMQLRDEGRLTLDDALLKHLPNFRNADMRRLRKVTLRHLLTHQSGIDGDFFPRTDSGDRSIEQLLEMASMVPSLFEPGTNYSYCNVGFSALGRIIEILDNCTYDESLKVRIFDPLEMTRAFSRPEDNIRFRVAMGHVPEAHKPGQLIVPEEPYLSIGHKAAGTTPAMTASDLLRFAGAHLHNGLGLNGNRIMKAATAKEMRRLHVRGTDRHGDWNWSIGLAWIMADWHGKKIFGHTGGTVGQFSELIVCKEKNIAVAALTNGGDALGFMREITGGILKSVGITMAELPKPEENVRTNSAELTGHYGNISTVIKVSDDNGVLKIANRAPEKEQFGPTATIRFVKPRLGRIPMGTLEFGGQKGRSAEWIRTGSRLFPRLWS